MITATLARAGYATADTRYAGGIRSGALAELLGLGRHGIRRPQVIVILIGSAASAGVWQIRSMIGGDTPDAEALLWTAIWPAFFLFAAITAVRSFQGIAAVAVLTGLLNSILVTGMRLVFFDYASIGYFEGVPLWVRAAVMSFIWPALTMVALGLALSTRAIWVPMVIALFAASVVQAYIGGGIYGNGWSPSLLPLSTMAIQLVSDVIQVLTYWYALTRFGYDRSA